VVLVLANRGASPGRCLPLKRPAWTGDKRFREAGRRDADESRRIDGARAALEGLGAAPNVRVEGRSVVDSMEQVDGLTQGAHSECELSAPQPRDAKRRHGGPPGELAGASTRERDALLKRRNRRVGLLVGYRKAIGKQRDSENGRVGDVACDTKALLRFRSTRRITGPHKIE